MCTAASIAGLQPRPRFNSRGFATRRFRNRLSIATTAFLVHGPHGRSALGRSLISLSLSSRRAARCGAAFVRSLRSLLSANAQGGFEAFLAIRLVTVRGSFSSVNGVQLHSEIEFERFRPPLFDLDLAQVPDNRYIPIEDPRKRVSRTVLFPICRSYRLRSIDLVAERD